ncbi:MAG TPA: archease [Candidatus Omnitrophota bacterium]|jgi:SHS2 domain-containing protein|nr:archease [Candidatus Omnitrophota bacterium]HPN56224.1 archease [Candidatus Omnitrophota bacterium]
MSFRYLDDIATADIAFLAQGPSLETLFQSAAEATVLVMVDNLKSIQPRCQRTVGFQADDVESLLFNFLQEIIYYKDAEQLLLVPDAIMIQTCPGGYDLKSVLRGEGIEPRRHHLIVDIKAVTMHLFRVTPNAQGWEALVVLDI